jgi:hypothetical protein
MMLPWMITAPVERITVPEGTVSTAPTKKAVH